MLGGGPAGLAAAAAAAEAGAEVVLVDERAKLGGQFYKQPPEASVVDEAALDRQYRDGRRADRAGRARRRGACSRASRCGRATGPRELLALDAAHAYALRPQRLVLATGAYERGVPLPGWTLPGFLTTGAAQTLMRAYGVLPGRRVLVSGNGPLNIQVAAEIVRAGGEVVAVCELASLAARLGRGARWRLAVPALMAQGARLTRELRRARRAAPDAARGGPRRGRRARSSARSSRGSTRAGRPVPGSERHVRGRRRLRRVRLPALERARPDARASSTGSTSGSASWPPSSTSAAAPRVDGVWVVGRRRRHRRRAARAARSGCSPASTPRGASAVTPPRLRARSGRRARERARSRRFQRGLNRLFAAPRLVDQLADAGDARLPLRGGLARGGRGVVRRRRGAIGAVKRVTRAGMGRCQGRYCASVLAELAARRSGSAAQRGRLVRARAAVQAGRRSARPRPRSRRSQKRDGANGLRSTLGVLAEREAARRAGRRAARR